MPHIATKQIQSNFPIVTYNKRKLKIHDDLLLATTCDVEAYNCLLEDSWKITKWKEVNTMKVMHL
jgi:hypothetical protein